MLRQYFNAQKASFCDLRRKHGKFCHPDHVVDSFSNNERLDAIQCS